MKKQPEKKPRINTRIDQELHDGLMDYLETKREENPDIKLSDVVREILHAGLLGAKSPANQKLEKIFNVLILIATHLKISKNDILKSISKKNINNEEKRKS